MSAGPQLSKHQKTENERHGYLHLGFLFPPDGLKPGTSFYFPVTGHSSELSYPPPPDFETQNSG